MKKVIRFIFTSFTFYFMIFSIYLIYNQITGGDSKNILLIGFNGILEGLYDIEGFRELINSGPMIKTRTVIGETSIYLYIAHFITFIIYGVMFDLFKMLFKKSRNKSK